MNLKNIIRRKDIQQDIISDSGMKTRTDVFSLYVIIISVLLSLGLIVLGVLFYVS